MDQLKDYKNQLIELENLLKKYKKIVKFKKYLIDNKLRLINDEKQIYYDLLKDKQFLLELMEYQPEIYPNLDREMKKDIDIASKAFINYNNNIMSMPQGLFKNQEFLKNIFSKLTQYNILNYTIFLKMDINNFYLIPKEFRSQKKYILKLLPINAMGILKKIDYCYHDDDDVIKSAITYDVNCFQYASPRLKDDFEVLKMVFNKDHTLIKFASKRILEEIRYIADAELFARKSKWIDLEDVD